MKKAILLAALLAPTFLFAQVGIGTTTINSSAKLQIDATNKGVLPPRVALTGTGTTSNAVASPATGLLVYNTATAGSGTAAVTPGYYYYTGTQWARFLSSTTAETQVTGSMSAIGFTIPSGDRYQTIAGGYNDYWNPMFLGLSITLPPGKWSIHASVPLIVDNGIRNGYTDPNWTSIFSGFKFWLQENTTVSGTYSPQLHDISSYSTADILSGTAKSSVFAQVNGYPQPVFMINNTSGGNKTYYLMGREIAQDDPFVNINNEPIMHGYFHPSRPYPASDFGIYADPVQ